MIKIFKKTAFPCNLTLISLVKANKTNLKIMEAALVFISAFATIFGILFYYFKTRNAERLALIQAGADASLFTSPHRKRRNGYFIVMMFGLVFIAIGLGIWAGYFIESQMLNTYLERNPDYKFNKDFPQAYFIAIFTFAGTALIASYLLDRKLNKE
ncbi:DUF6249 domain-containing protein [Litoribacter populi]|uniref:DUF6249 domain-containing protein n=1 Tax=Litoribacter populi TaxID=2598460 RepID=UPI00117F5B7C|nr:DUF6249 domain-containing protein [Litoribacter populi]